jgi:AAA+ ATPase superfamily predicted ATPase
MTYEVDKPKKNWVTLDGEEIAPKSVNGVLTALSEKEAKQLTTERKVWEDSADERTLQRIRDIRDNILNKTDWKIIKAIEQGEELSEEFKTWRQNLRNVPQDYKPSDYDKLLESDTTTRELKHSIWQEPKE